jgi:predicted nucleotidyltransferase
MEIKLKDNLEGVRALCESHYVKNFYAFGSSVNKSFNETSDYDFLVSFHEDLPLLSFAKNFFSLQNKLEALLNRKVDLVSEESLKNPILIENILASRISIYDFQAA